MAAWLRGPPSIAPRSPTHPLCLPPRRDSALAPPCLRPHHLRAPPPPAMPALFDFFGPEERWALTLTTFAGLSTAVGGLVAVLRPPDDSMLAFLLGTAIGVMALLSAEMWVANAWEHGWPGVTTAALCGLLAYQLLSPLLPDFDAAAELGAGGKSPPARPRRADSLPESGELPLPGERPLQSPARARELLRLGTLMALTMSAHNFPEGLAVAFSSYTDFGVIMAVAVAMHNIPEGYIISLPLYVATGSRAKALGVATLSGLTEPLGALVALGLGRPLLAAQRIPYVLAFVGGIMGAVCVCDLWPEGKKCRADAKMHAGIAVGAAAMAWTLWMGI